MLAAIAALGRRPRDLKRIVLTHAHRSHLGGLATLKRETGARCSRTRGRRTSSRASARRSPSTCKPMRPLRTYPFQLGIFLNRPQHEPCPVDGTVADGDAVGPLQVLHAPGHSPGHLAFHWPSAGS